jgi:hypothetical protein
MWSHHKIVSERTGISEVLVGESDPAETENHFEVTLYRGSGNKFLLYWFLSNESRYELDILTIF